MIKLEISENNIERGKVISVALKSKTVDTFLYFGIKEQKMIKSLMEQAKEMIESLEKGG